MGLSSFGDPPLGWCFKEHTSNTNHLRAAVPQRFRSRCFGRTYRKLWLSFWLPIQPARNGVPKKGHAQWACPTSQARRERLQRPAIRLKASVRGASIRSKVFLTVDRTKQPVRRHKPEHRQAETGRQIRQKSRPAEQKSKQASKKASIGTTTPPPLPPAPPPLPSPPLPRIQQRTRKGHGALPDRAEFVSGHERHTSWTVCA